MAKSGRQYADDVRDLRASGIEFATASRGYLLADAANWSSGQKAAVTRAINALDIEVEDDEGGLTDAEIDEFFEDSIAEDNFDADFDDVDYFDFDEAEEFVDEEADEYTED